jgi:hypothetical protein
MVDVALVIYTCLGKLNGNYYLSKNLTTEIQLVLIQGYSQATAVIIGNLFFVVRCCCRYRCWYRYHSSEVKSYLVCQFVRGKQRWLFV